MKKILFIVMTLLCTKAFSQTLIYEAQKKEINLTEKDKKILEIGEISTASYIVGGILGTYPIGLGLGHVVQGRWTEDGQIFTWGQLASLGVVVLGAMGCLNNYDSDNGNWDCSDGESALITVGAVGYIGLRIWEIVDVWSTPVSYNRKHRELKKYINDQETKPVLKSSLDLVPLVNPKLGQGLGLRYTF